MRKLLIVSFFVVLSCNCFAQLKQTEPVQGIPPPEGLGCMIYPTLYLGSNGTAEVNILSITNYIRNFALQNWNYNLSGYTIRLYYNEIDRNNNTNAISTPSTVIGNGVAFFIRLTYIGGGPQYNFPTSFLNCVEVNFFSPTGDTDQDSIPNLAEDLNNNGDISDDNTDNVGWPNFSDSDDDNDGILTINEDYNGNGSPLDDDMNLNGIPDYLDNLARGALQLNLKLFIEGYYLGSGTMKSVKRNQDGISPVTDVENITLELHRNTTPYALVASATGILKTNGTISCSFPTASVGSYYVVVKSNNGIETWSATPQSVSNVAITYNFSSAASKAYGSNMKDLGGGIFGLYSGDLNHDGNIDTLDYPTWEADSNNFLSGIYSTDFNGDGNVDTLDYPILETSMNNFIYVSRP